MERIMVVLAVVATGALVGESLLAVVEAQDGVAALRAILVVRGRAEAPALGTGQRGALAAVFSALRESWGR
jgi:hypothetical protein